MEWTLYHQLNFARNECSLILLETGKGPIDWLIDRERTAFGYNPFKSLENENKYCNSQNRTEKIKQTTFNHIQKQKP